MTSFRSDDHYVNILVSVFDDIHRSTSSRLTKVEESVCILIAAVLGNLEFSVTVG